MGYGMMGYGGMGSGGMGYGMMGYSGMGSGGMGYGMMGYGGMGSGGYSRYGMMPPPPAPASEVEVTIYDNYFEPRTAYVTPGGTVRWINKGKHVHTVRGLAGHWGSKDLQPGMSYTYTLPECLNYSYYCSYHPLEMNGSIVVRPALPRRPQGQGGYTNSGY
jgi:plastocyanin